MYITLGSKNTTVNKPLSHSNNSVEGCDDALSITNSTFPIFLPDIFEKLLHFGYKGVVIPINKQFDVHHTLPLMCT